MVKMEDLSILERDAKDEFDNPLPQKPVDGRIIYLARNDYGMFSREKPAGVIEITDFDTSVLGAAPHTGCIQAESYRAPEVIVGAGYGYPADIWSLGVLVRCAGRRF
jgi:serine/threonine protein kinase